MTGESSIGLHRDSSTNESDWEPCGPGPQFSLKPTAQLKEKFTGHDLPGTTARLLARYGRVIAPQSAASQAADTARLKHLSLAKKGSTIPKAVVGLLKGLLKKEDWVTMGVDVASAMHSYEAADALGKTWLKSLRAVDDDCVEMTPLALSSVMKHAPSATPWGGAPLDERNHRAYVLSFPESILSSVSPPVPESKNYSEQARAFVDIRVKSSEAVTLVPLPSSVPKFDERATQPGWAIQFEFNRSGRNQVYVVQLIRIAELYLGGPVVFGYAAAELDGKAFLKTLKRAAKWGLGAPWGERCLQLPPGVTICLRRDILSFYGANVAHGTTLPPGSGEHEGGEDNGVVREGPERIYQGAFDALTEVHDPQPELELELEYREKLRAIRLCQMGEVQAELAKLEGLNLNQETTEKSIEVKRAFAKRLNQVMRDLGYAFVCPSKSCSELAGSLRVTRSGHGQFQFSHTSGPSTGAAHGGSSKIPKLDIAPKPRA